MTSVIVSKVIEVWRGSSNPFENGAAHKTGGKTMRCCLDSSSDTVTFEVVDGNDAMGQAIWRRTEWVPSQFIINAAHAFATPRHNP